MLNGYEAFLININEKYPELYIQLVEYNPDIVKGWINELTEDKIKLDDEKSIKDFFRIKFVYTREWSHKIFFYAPFIPASFSRGKLS